MGRLTRNFNWSATSLGSPETWPQSLCTILGVLLNSKFPMFLWWGNDLIQFYNDAYRPSLGNEGKHPLALGQKGVDCWQEIWPVIKPLIDHVLTTGEGTWSEDQLIPIYRNGHLEDVYWTFGYSPVFDESNKPAGVLVTCTETTEKIKNFLRLKDSEDQLRFAIEATELGTWDYNPVTNHFFANDILKAWFGLASNENIDLNVALNVVAEGDRKRVAEAIQNALQYTSGGYYDIEYTIINPHTKKEIIVHAKGRAWFNNEKVAYRFNGTLQDVTEQVIARRKLEEAEEKAQLYINAAQLGTFEINLANDEVLTSPRFDAIFGIPHSTAHNDYTKLIHADDLSIREQAFKNAFETGHLEYEIRIIWPDNSIHWISAKGNVWFDENNKPVKILGMVQDITEQKAFYEELERQVLERTAELQANNRELQRSNANLEEFAHAASHDLKEPIRKIQFFTDRLKNQLSDRLSEEEKTTFTRIENASKRMSALIDDLLLYSHVSLRPHQTEEINLNDKLTRVLEDLELDIQQKKAVITVGKLPVIKGYRRQLQQLFQNLISNALKYMKADETPRIEITSEIVPGTALGALISENDAKKDYHLIQVKDNGIGFNQAEAEKIFQMFHRLHGNKEYMGTGVGLSIARKVVENHHGKIVAESTPGNGATFKVYLPVS